MSKTLRFGSARNASLADLKARIDRHVIRRHTPCGYDRMMDLAAQDYARHVALEVTPHLKARPQVRYVATAKGFGKRPG